MILEQNKVFDSFKMFSETQLWNFPEQARIYEYIAHTLRVTESVFEVGAGTGAGAALMDRECLKADASDISPWCVAFMKAVYPWLGVIRWDMVQGKIPSAHDIVVAVEVIEHTYKPERFAKNLIKSASKKIWLSTPNPKERDAVPKNSYHVKEFQPDQVCAMFSGAEDIKIYECETFKEQGMDTKRSPLLYEVLV